VSVPDVNPDGRVLVLSDRPDPARRQALCALAPPGREARTVELGVRPPLASAEAVVVDGPGLLTAAVRAELDQVLARGGVVLVLPGSTPDSASGRLPSPDDSGWAPAAGLRWGPWLAAAEWMIETRPENPLGVRLPSEWPLVDRLRPLGTEGPAPGGSALRPDAVVAVCSVGFSDRPVVVRRQVGAGALVVAGVGSETGALVETHLRHLFARVLANVATPTRPLGVAIVGYGPFGGMGLHHGLALRATDGLELVAVVDASDERRAAATVDFPGVRTYPSAADLARDPDVDVAIVATPPSSHVPLTLELLRAGRHVVCEKPLCFRAEEADLLVATAAEVDRVLTVHQNRRFDGDFLAAVRLIEAGAIGEVFNVETFVGTFAHPCRAWHSEVRVSGGAIYDWGAHYIDWTLRLLDAVPASVTAIGHKRVWHDVTNHDQVRVHMTFDDGREAEFVHSDVAAIARPKLYLQGTAGTIAGSYRPLHLERIEPGLGYRDERPHFAEAPVVLEVARYESGVGVVTSQVVPQVTEGFPFHANLADHLLLGEPLAVTPTSVRSVVAVLEAAQRSLAAGGVPIPPAAPSDTGPSDRRPTQSGPVGGVDSRECVTATGRPSR